MESSKLRATAPAVLALYLLLPEVVREHWWQHLLHGQRLRRLQAALLRYGGSRIVVMIIPWHLEEPRIEEGLEKEETPSTAA